MSIRAWRIGFVLAALGAAAACSLSPQPLPPGDAPSRTSDAGLGDNNGDPTAKSDAGGTGKDADGSVNPPTDASIDGSPPPAADAGDASDAGDGGTDATSDAPTDAADG